MPEFFIRANSFAAPFFSDTSTGYVDADTAEEALVKYAETYSHPCGLYSAVCYASADTMHKGEKFLARWLCNHEREVARLTQDLGSYSYLGHGPGDFEIDHVRHTVDSPKNGAVAP